jgi:hypothetical protein
LFPHHWPIHIIIAPSSLFVISYSRFVSFATNQHPTNPNNFNIIQNGTMVALAKINKAIGQADEINKRHCRAAGRTCL